MSAMSKADGKRVLAGATVGIPPRQMNFRFPAGERRYMYGDNATASMFMTVLSGIFPPGERFFMQSVRPFRHLVTDDRLKAQVSGFMGQEAIHGREHERLNEYLQARGIDATIPERAVRAGLWLLERLPARQQLACTTLMEHFTAALAERFLDDEEFCNNMDKELLMLWQWHALEELEHKSVAYDVFTLAEGRWSERLLAAPLVVATVLPGILLTWGLLLAREGKLRDAADIRQGLGSLLGRKGLLMGVLPLLPEFARRRFHPAQRDTRALEGEWRERLFGSAGALLGQWKNPEASGGQAVPL